MLGTFNIFGYLGERWESLNYDTNVDKPICQFIMKIEKELISSGYF